MALHQAGAQVGSTITNGTTSSGPRISAGAVVTSDYLPWARATARSFFAHHPDPRCVVLVVDEPDPVLLRDDGLFELCTRAEVGMSVAELSWMERIYDGLEICCAFKPWLLRHLLADADVATPPTPIRTRPARR